MIAYDNTNEINQEHPNMKYEDFPRVQSELYTAVLSDMLDSLGFRNQSLAPNVRPLDDSLTIFGRVRTGLYMSVYEVAENVNPYEKEIELIDSLEPGEVPVLACPQNQRVVPWGELLSTAARARGANGCVTDGMARDIKMIREMRFPVFAAGARPLDSKGRAIIIEIDTTIECGGARARSGDYVFGDVDGVLIIPAEVADEVIDRAFGKVAGENLVRIELAEGQKLRDVFARHGIL
jgi:4-hydroxy-4-methyl-2-oxoglutarate aldolase